MMTRSVAALAVVLGACGTEQVQSRQAAVTGGDTLIECVGLFAADIGDACGRPGVARAPLAGELASADGFVAGPGGELGGEVVSDAPVSPAAPAPVKHCTNAAELSAAAAAHVPALRACIEARKDPATPCGAIADAPCPPTASEIECEHARAVAADACTVTL